MKIPPNDSKYSRRNVLLGSLGVAGLGILNSCAPTTKNTAGLATTKSTTTDKISLAPQETEFKLDNKIVKTWGFNQQIPGPIIRGTLGKPLEIAVHNQLPEETSVHWHGLHVPNSMDGVPDLTQTPIEPGTSFTYKFTPTNAGTHFYHPHSGLQLDTGLYAPLIIDDPQEKLAYDEEWIIVVDDWLDGTGTTPELTLEKLLAGDTAGMQHMDHDMQGMHMNHPMSMHAKMNMSPGEDTGDVAYPYYLINGKTMNHPEVFSVKPNRRIRLRMINASSDTTYLLALQNHKLNLTHSDGYAVKPVETAALLLAMGERYDALIETKEVGNFALLAKPQGKTGVAKAILQVGNPTADKESMQDIVVTDIPELHEQVIMGTDLTASEASILPYKNPDQEVEVILNGTMMPYVWTINGKTWGKNTPIKVNEHKRIRMIITNDSAMAHPMHIHGHTWSLPNNGGVRKDTVLVPAKGKIIADLETNNPGKWMFHCHNLYHMAAGTMTTMDYS